MNKRPAVLARNYAEGIGEAVADRSVNRKIEVTLDKPEKRVVTIPRRDDISLDAEVAEYCLSNGLIHSDYTVLHGDQETVEIELTVTGERRKEKWADVARRVAFGNSLLAPHKDQVYEQADLQHHLRQASLLLSGRHLQHGDADQPNRNIEVFTNCSTSAVSFLTFYLLLNGSGVGRAYDDVMMVVDWRNMPLTVPVIDAGHADVLSGEIEALTLNQAKHLYAGSNIEIFTVPDSREGWAQALEKIETSAFLGERDKVLLLDFSDVRPRGAPIGGMQNRPASGPGPIMNAIKRIGRLRDVAAEPWRQAMYVDHYLAECVLVGGARRAARMATKDWRDRNVLDFVFIKRPVEFLGKSGPEIAEMRKTGWFSGFLWSSNNSVTVDAEFWEAVRKVSELVRDHIRPFDLNSLLLRGAVTEQEAHAWKVFNAVCEASYYDGTGEPGFINQDRLVENNEGIDHYRRAAFVGSEKYQLLKETHDLMTALVERFEQCEFKMITNPCGEIALTKLGGYCVIADVVPYHAQDDDDAEHAFRTAARALIRTNLMDALYGPEVKRPNRIGVGFTGIHEYAYARFGYGWKDLVNEEASKDFWLMLSRFKRAVRDEVINYSKYLGVSVPHTDTTVKPAGTTSKLFSLTEGAHLASMREYIRWVQFRNDDPIVEEYREKGYPVRKLKVYEGTTIVGFPTQPEICKLGMGDKLVTAGEATPEEQYQWLRLLEKYWIVGVEEDGVTSLPNTGNQVSYTLKYNPEVVSYAEFRRTLLEGQSSIRCCSVMLQTDSSAYEYRPEEAVTKEEYERISQAIQAAMEEDVGIEHVDCSTGACPINFGDKVA